MPENAPECQWFFADVVLEITVEDAEKNVVHINTHLVRAQTAEQAFKKAKSLGMQQEDRYLNSSGKNVEVRFRGLSELLPIYEDLTDGAEIWFKEKIGLSEEDVRAMVMRKQDLSLFRKREKLDIPDYVPAQVWEKLENLGYPQKDKH
ncbi:MAG: DUF4288 domain-containing protein [Calditrichia bacterium]